jgi:hypothetical protein
MRTCGGCTLCCKLPRIAEVEKPRDVWCRHCDIGKGCKIYSDRPTVCKDFECWWLRHEEMPEELRPDRVECCVVGGEVMKIMVDPKSTGNGVAKVLDYLRDQHKIVARGNQVIWFAAEGRPAPDKIILEWVL